MYKRVLLKISGEQLAGKHEWGIDPEVAKYLAGECQKAVDQGSQMVLIVGGGNMVRGAEVAGNGIKRVTSEQMGMISGLINAMALTDIFESCGLDVTCMSNLYVNQIAEPYSYRAAMKHLSKNRIVVVAGGLSRPFFTHDTAAINYALELSCEVVLKATKVDGVYDRDPVKYPEAKLLQTVTYQQAVENNEIKVMDKAALGLAMEQNMPVIVLNPMQPGNIAAATIGQDVGTHIQ
jgi:uridylate kinase